MTYLQRVMAGNKAVRSSRLTSGFSKGLGHIATMPFKGEVGFLGTAGLALSALSYDSTKDSLVGHMGKSMGQLGVGAVRDAILFNTLGKLGPIGWVASLGISMGSDMIMDHGVNSILKQRNREMGVRPVTQNERTMRATQQAMSMLGQSGRMSMLGQEAAYMHN